MRFSALVVSVLLLAASSAPETTIAQATGSAPAPTVQLLAPLDNAYVSGPTPLRARIDPESAATTVVFYADGRVVCTLAHAPFECDWDAGAGVVEHEVRLVVNLVSGGRVVRTARTKGVGYAEAVDVNVVQVTATVTDGRHFVRGLPRSAFHVYEDGQPQAMTHFASENVPLDLVVAVDVSGSMKPSVPTLKTAVKAFLTAVPATDQVTLLAFNDSIFTLARQATDPVGRAKAVDRLAAWGGTALYDVIIRGVELLGRRTGRKALIVFTDGEDQGSHAPIEEVEQRLQASDVTLYMIGQGRGTELEPLKKIMQRLAQPTGGRALFTEKIDELHGAFTELLDELSSQYLLGYAPPDAGRSATLHQIKVEVDGHYRVRARQAYRAAGQP